MICLGVDPGQSRVGLALGQDSLAIALETLVLEGAVEKIKAIASDKRAERIYVGLPISLSGSTTQSTQRAVDFASELAAEIEQPVYLVDERLTTSQSLRLVQQAGKSARDSKSFIDAESARLIVESAIASNHSLGTPLEEYLARN